MKTIITYEISGPEDQRFEDMWNDMHFNPETDSMAGGYICLAENSKIEKEFQDFYQCFLGKYPGGVIIETLGREIQYSEKDKKGFEIFTCVPGHTIVLQEKEFYESFECIEECSVCHRSICHQTKDIILKTSKLKKDFNEIAYLSDKPFHAIAWVVSSDLKAILGDMGCNVRFQNVIDKDSLLVSKDFFQLHIDYVYSPIQAPTALIHNKQCPECGKYLEVWIGKAFNINSSELYFMPQRLWSRWITSKPDGQQKPPSKTVCSFPCSAFENSRGRI